MAAHDVMQNGPQVDVETIGTEARARFGAALPVPLFAIHGDDDAVVSPANSIALVRQYLNLNGHPAVGFETLAPGALPDADSTITASTADGRDVTTREWRVDGRLVVRYVAIAGSATRGAATPHWHSTTPVRPMRPSSSANSCARHFPRRRCRNGNGDAAGFEPRHLGS
jgi:hypothetical protein